MRSCGETCGGGGEGVAASREIARRNAFMGPNEKEVSYRHRGRTVLEVERF
jgi:hypothetical protein